MVLAFASAIAYITAEILRGRPIYDALLQRSLAASPDTACEEEKNMIEVPIASGSLLENRPISELPPMKQTVIVEIKRSGKSLIPDPDTRLRAGDFLYILSESRNAETLKRMGEESNVK